jgi:hypothetical protein
MNYKKIYDRIIKNAKLLQDDRIKLYRTDKTKYYFEGHHIIPKSVGGLGNSRKWCEIEIQKRHDNIVGLTPREHFICHKLLCLIYPKNRSLINALWRMVCRPRNFQVRYIPSGREYQKIREEFIRNHHNSTVEGRLRCSIRVRGSKNPMHGKLKTDAEKQNLREKMSGSSNPFYGKTHSTESVELIKQSIKSRGGYFGGNNPRAIPVVIQGIRYDCIKDAVFALNITKYRVKQLNELK